MNPIVLEAKNITKRFPGVLANDQVNLTLHEGEVLALLGENGGGQKHVDEHFIRAVPPG